MAQKNTKTDVFGIDAPAPKLTRAGYKAIALYILVPFFSFLVLLDFVGYLIAKYAFQTCYGILCLL